MSALDNSDKKVTRLPEAPPLSTNSSADASADGLETTGGLLAARRPVKNRWGDLGLALLYLSPAMAVFGVFTFAPFFRSIWLSFFVTDATGEAVRFNDVKYYSRILNLDGSGRDEYLKSLVTTLQFSLMVVPLGIVTSVGLALLATAKVRTIGIFRTIFTSSIAISVASAGVIWSLIYSPSTRMTQWVVDLFHLKADSLLNNAASALAAVAFMTIWTALGFNFIITLSGLQAIPQDLYESGLIDGTSGWTAFRYITLPLLTPTLLFLFIISTIQCFQSFTQFYVLIGNEGPDNSTNVFVYALFSAFWKDNRYGFASAISTVLFVVLLVLTIIQYRVLNRKVHYQ